MQRVAWEDEPSGECGCPAGFDEVEVARLVRTVDFVADDGVANVLATNSTFQDDSATTDGAGHPNDAYCPTLHDTVQFAQFWVAFSLKKPALHPPGQLLPVLSAEGPRYTACAFWGLLLHVPLHV